MNRCLSWLAPADFRVVGGPQRGSKARTLLPPYSTREIFRLTRVTRIFQTSIFTKTTCGSPFRCGRFFDGASARNDRMRHPHVGGAGPSPLKLTACHTRTATPDKIGGPSAARASFRDASGPHGAVR